MDNPLAFPSGDFMNMQPQDGMTLRDYFAAKAMQGFTQFWGNSTEEEIARRAYKLADAMLVQRAADPPRAEP